MLGQGGIGKTLGIVGSSVGKGGDRGKGKGGVYSPPTPNPHTLVMTCKTKEEGREHMWRGEGSICGGGGGGCT